MNKKNSENLSKPFVKRKLSQNFLIDQNIVDKILAVAKLSSNDTVLEIGPGRGALTRKIVTQSKEAVAIEFDSNLIADLDYLKVYEADFLKFDLSQLSSPPYKVISNLPYHITSKILEKLALNKPHFTSLTLMVQDEFADKLLHPMETALITFLHYHYSIEKHFTVSRNCYYPKPNVSSAVITLEPNNHPLDPNFYHFLKKGYAQKRKFLRTQLKPHYPATDTAFEKLNLDPKVRIGALTPQIAHTLFSLIDSH